VDALSLADVGFSYVAGFPTVQDVTFGVKRGEFLTIVGPNGSGKSTLLKLCSKTISPHQGKIFLVGRDLQKYSRGEIARTLAVVSQEHFLQFPFTVSEVVLMGRAPYGRGSMFERDEDRAVAAAMMRKTDIEHLADKPVTDLSGGERQRAFIARALAQQPKIILLDEPNAHLDIAHQVDVFGLMKHMNGEEGTTVVAVSHDLNLAASYSDRIAMLMCGTLVAIGAPEEVLTPDRIAEVFQTHVLVDRHPVSDRPRVTLVQGREGLVPWGRGVAD
jgi:iron complex transport system ATP-binding protein